MQHLDLTLPSPEENLALDEALLLSAEANNCGEVLRFWMPTNPFIVIGIGAKVEQEVDLSACKTGGIPILRRCSGGGTVLQAHGCLNYSLVLKINPTGDLQTIHSTNQYVMNRNGRALSELLECTVDVGGHTDLVIDNRKVSGNAQRRLKSHLLFHGTFLWNIDIALISKLMRQPKLQPEYRHNRTHADFLSNLPASAEDIKKAMRTAWNATGNASDHTMEATNQLVEERYSQDDWNFKR